MPRDISLSNFSSNLDGEFSETNKNLSDYPDQIATSVDNSRMELVSRTHKRAEFKTKLVLCCIGGLFFITAVVSIPLIIFIFHIVPTRICGEEKRFFLPSTNCSTDGFSEVRYFVNNTCLTTNKRYLKYKLIDDIDNDQFYNYTSAQKECQRLNASMWEVLDGQPEWQVVIENIKKISRSNVWLSAQVLENCQQNTDGSIQEDDLTCKHNDALKGKGLKINWPLTKFIPDTYSRLIRGFDPNVVKKCVFVDDKNEHVWDVHECASPRYWGLCVKRTCFPSHINK